MKTKKFSPKTYFTSGKFSVIDYEDVSFANFKVTNTSRCFKKLEEAILYAIGMNCGKRNDNELMIIIEAFITMITK
jgi:hypothetical protein